MARRPRRAAAAIGRAAGEDAAARRHRAPARQQLPPPLRGAALLPLLLLLLLQPAAAVDGGPHVPPPNTRTAYLVASMAATYEPRNSSFNDLREVLLQGGTFDNYDFVILTEDYTILNPKQYTQGEQIKLMSNLTILSTPGQRFILTFSFVSNGVFMNRFTVKLTRMAVNMARKTSGQSVPFFGGEGTLLLDDVLRMRLACSARVNTSVNTLRNTPRLPGEPGPQRVSLVDYSFRGRDYPGSVYAEDLSLFVSPGDVEDAAYYAGFQIKQRNVTRLCDSYVPAGCNEVCLVQTIEAVLASRADAAAGAGAGRAAAIAVPVAVGTVALVAAAGGLFAWRRRRRRKAAGALLPKQQRAQEGSTSKHGPQPRHGPSGGAGGAGLHGAGSGVPQHAAAKLASGSSGLLRSPDMGAVGSIEEVAVGGPAAIGPHAGWHLMACHTAPEFPEASAKDTITLGVLLGAGSFGRVYRGHWRGHDVAVKIMHHDVNTAAAVANEVDLVMSFRHPNITAAYYFVTWNYDKHSDEMSGSTPSSSAAAAVPAAPAAALAAGGAQQQHARGSSGSMELQRPVGASPGAAAAAPSAPAAGGDPGAAAAVLLQPCSSGGSGQAMARLMPAMGSHVLIDRQLSGAPQSAPGSGAQQQQAGSSSLGPDTPMRTLPSAALPAARSSSDQVHARSPSRGQQTPHQQQPQQIVPVVSFRSSPAAQAAAGGVQQQPQYVQLLVPMEAPPNGDSHQQQLPAGDQAHAPDQQQQQQQQQHRLLQLPAAGSASTGSSYMVIDGSRRRSAGGGKPAEAMTWLILEHCDGGTLLDVMQDGSLVSRSGSTVNLSHVLTLLLDVAAGMGYLHSRNCVHGDLKPANVLLKHEPAAPFGHLAKVSDFGLSKTMTTGQSHRSTKTLGTFNRAPPELLRLGRLSPACDVYAFGILMWELYTGRVAFGGLHYGEVFERVALLQERPAVPATMPPAYASLMCACWEPDPLARPTFGFVQEQLAELLRGLPDASERFFSDL